MHYGVCIIVNLKDFKWLRLEVDWMPCFTLNCYPLCFPQMENMQAVGTVPLNITPFKSRTMLCDMRWSMPVFLRLIKAGLDNSGHGSVKASPASVHLFIHSHSQCTLASVQRKPDQLCCPWWLSAMAMRHINYTPFSHNTDMKHCVHYCFWKMYWLFLT